jgi:F-type H+-transporting ATPase subunit delta
MPDRPDSERIEGFASAIFELAKAEGELEKVERELFTIARTFATSNELRDALTNPQLGPERKQGIIDDLIGGRASDLTAEVVSMIVRLGHGSDLPAIVDAFVEKVAASKARAVAEIRSAIQLDKKTLDRLTTALSKATGKKLEVKYIVDPELIGGVVARIGDTVIDGSIARKLATLRQALQRA